MPGNSAMVRAKVCILLSHITPALCLRVRLCEQPFMM
jgi:hypothetical protein